MPRIKTGFQDPPRKSDQRLVDRLADELQAGRDSGQPFIYEQAFSTGKLRVLVIWDEWKDLPLEQRTSIIAAAIEKSDGKDYRAKVALASGLTVLEGVAAGMLPYRIIPALRSGDGVTPEQCRQAMLAEGASQLFGPSAVHLRFPTADAADACRKRLIKNLDRSDDIWIVSQEVTAQDFEQVSESVATGPG